MCLRIVLNLFGVTMYLSQELASFVHQQAAVVEEQSMTIKELSIANARQSVTIQRQAALIQQLVEETGVRLSCLF